MIIILFRNIYSMKKIFLVKTSFFQISLSHMSKKTLVGNCFTKKLNTKLQKQYGKQFLWKQALLVAFNFTVTHNLTPRSLKLRTFTKKYMSNWFLKLYYSYLVIGLFITNIQGRNQLAKSEKTLFHLFYFFCGADSHLPPPPVLIIHTEEEITAFFYKTLSSKDLNILNII